jgi:hypothetical protein
MVQIMLPMSTPLDAPCDRNESDLLQYPSEHALSISSGCLIAMYPMEGKKIIVGTTGAFMQFTFLANRQGAAIALNRLRSFDFL